MPLRKRVNIPPLLSKSSLRELFKGKLYPAGSSQPPRLCARIKLPSPTLKRNYSSAPHSPQISTNLALHSHSQASLSSSLQSLSGNFLLLRFMALLTSASWGLLASPGGLRVPERWLLFFPRALQPSVSPLGGSRASRGLLVAGSALPAGNICSQLRDCSCSSCTLSTGRPHLKCPQPPLSHL